MTPNTNKPFAPDMERFLNASALFDANVPAKTLLSTIFGVFLLSGQAAANTVAWNSSTGGYWSDASKWTPVGVPLAGDDVFIATTSDSLFTVNVAKPASLPRYEAKSLQISSPNAVVSFTSEAELYLSDTLGMTAGKLTLYGLRGSSRTIQPAYLHADNGINVSGSGQIVTTGNVRLGGDISNSGLLDFRGGVWVDGSGTTGLLNNDGTVKMGSTGTLARISLATLNSGSFIVTSGQADVNGLTNLNDGLVQINGGRLELTHENLVNRGTIELMNNASNIGTLTNFTGELINEADGVIDAQVGDGGTRYIRNAMTNAGLINVAANLTLSRSGAEHINSGRIDLANGALFQISGASFNNTTSGLIQGNGTLDVRSASFTDNGTLSPGHSFGRIDILGNYEQGADGILELEIGTDGQDQLSISGNATFNGSLHLIFVDGYAPGSGDILDLVNGNIIANFANVELFGLQAGFEFNLTGGTGGLQLTALNDAVSLVPLPAAMWLMGSVLGIFALRSRRQG